MTNIYILKILGLSFINRIEKMYDYNTLINLNSNLHYFCILGLSFNGFNENQMDFIIGSIGIFGLTGLFLLGIFANRSKKAHLILYKAKMKQLALYNEITQRKAKLVEMDDKIKT